MTMRQFILTHLNGLRGGMIWSCYLEGWSYRWRIVGTDLWVIFRIVRWMLQWGSRRRIMNHKENAQTLSVLKECKSEISEMTSEVVWLVEGFVRVMLSNCFDMIAFRENVDTMTIRQQENKRHFNTLHRFFLISYCIFISPVIFVTTFLSYIMHC